MIREKIILKYIRDKDVLDIGSLGETQKYNLWELMNKKGKTKSLVGIDVRAFNEKNVILGNMEDYDFCKDFDVIIAGDVIGYVDNQGLFLDNIHKHLKEDGILIITTPNAKWLTVLFRPRPGYTFWHDKYTLFNILKRHKFQVKHFQYYCGNKHYYDFVKRVPTHRQQMLVICKKK